MLAGDNSFTIENIQNALDTWMEKMKAVQELVMQDPLSVATTNTVETGVSSIAIPIASFVQTLNDSLVGVGIALLVLIFYVGIFNTASSIAETKRPEFVFKSLVRVAVVGALVNGSYTLMRRILNVFQGIADILAGSDLGTVETLKVPSEIIDAVKNLGLMDKIVVFLISTLGSLAVTVAGFIIILSVYGRVFKICMYIIVAPIPIATLGAKSTAKYGEGFLKNFASVCLEAVIIILALKVYSLINGSVMSAQTFGEDMTAQTMVWNYLSTTVFNMLVLVTIIKAATTVSKEMMGG